MPIYPASSPVLPEDPRPLLAVTAGQARLIKEGYTYHGWAERNGVVYVFSAEQDRHWRATPEDRADCVVSVDLLSGLVTGIVRTIHVDARELCRANPTH